MPAKHALILALLLASGSGLSVAAGAGTSAEVEQLLVQAEASLASARDAGNAWTTTEKLMAAARQVDDHEEALELARRALLTANKAREQQQLEQRAWQARVPTR